MESIDKIHFDITGKKGGYDKFTKWAKKYENMEGDGTAKDIMDSIWRVLKPALPIIGTVAGIALRGGNKTKCPACGMNQDIPLLMEKLGGEKTGFLVLKYHDKYKGKGLFKKIKSKHLKLGNGSVGQRILIELAVLLLGPLARPFVEKLIGEYGSDAFKLLKKYAPKGFDWIKENISKLLKAKPKKGGLKCLPCNCEECMKQLEKNFEEGNITAEHIGGAARRQRNFADDLGDALAWGHRYLLAPLAPVIKLGLKIAGKGKKQKRGAGVLDDIWSVLKPILPIAFSVGRMAMGGKKPKRDSTKSEDVADSLIWLSRTFGYLVQHIPILGKIAALPFTNADLIANSINPSYQYIDPFGEDMEGGKLKKLDKKHMTNLEKFLERFPWDMIQDMFDQGFDDYSLLPPHLIKDRSRSIFGRGDKYKDRQDPNYNESNVPPLPKMENQAYKSYNIAMVKEGGKKKKIGKGKITDFIKDKKNKVAEFFKKYKKEIATGAASLAGITGALALLHNLDTPAKVIKLNPMQENISWGYADVDYPEGIETVRYEDV